MTDGIKPWQDSGTARISEAQRRMLNAVCSDLAKQVVWHGNRLGKDSWRHLLSGTLLGWTMVPGIDRGEGPAGFVMLGGSSLKLTRDQAKDAITVGLNIGDAPSEQGLGQEPVVWSDIVLLGLGVNPNDFR